MFLMIWRYKNVVLEEAGQENYAVKSSVHVNIKYITTQRYLTEDKQC